MYIKREIFIIENMLPLIEYIYMHKAYIRILRQRLVSRAHPWCHGVLHNAVLEHDFSRTYCYITI
jgi:hypothetical protein